MKSKVSVKIHAVATLEERRNRPRTRTAVLAPEPVRAVRILVPAKEGRKEGAAEVSCVITKSILYCLPPPFELKNREITRPTAKSLPAAHLLTLAAHVNIQGFA